MNKLKAWGHGRYIDGVYFVKLIIGRQRFTK